MDNPHNDKSKQYLLKFSPRTDFGEADFMVTSCNETAFRAVCLWPEWQSFALSIYGPKSCGKSHLAQIWKDCVQRTLPRPEQIPVIPAHGINMKNINKLANENSFLIIEDIDAEINEEAFFHLYNLFNIPKKYILFTSLQPLSKLRLKLPDLRSRLNIVPGAEILQPDDAMLTALIAKLFNDRQLAVSQEILEYILKHTERSFDFVSRLIAEIDDISLTYGRAVSVPIIKEALETISRNQQLELFI